MSRQSLTKADAKMTELWWEPTFVTAAARFGTDYTFETVRKKDPLKQIMRSCFPMEEEKGNQVYGAMDGAIRGNMFRQVQQRWLEWQKLFLSIIPFPEISAADLCVRLSSGARGVAVDQHCEDLCRSLRAASCVGWAHAEGVGSAVAGADDRDALASQTDRPPCHRDHTPQQANSRRSHIGCRTLPAPTMEQDDIGHLSRCLWRSRGSDAVLAVRPT